MTGYPFRFGVQADLEDASALPAWVRTIEDLGFDYLCWSDHIEGTIDPVAAMGSAATHTERIRLASLMFADGTRHPAVHARIALTLANLSGGRFDLGIGAGWRAADYEVLGLHFDDAATRVARLRESVDLIDHLLGDYWSADRKGPPARRPRLVMGGGGPSVLTLAARRADIVFLNPTLTPGKTMGDRVLEMVDANVLRKADLVRLEATKAGRDSKGIELGTMLTLAADAERTAQALGVSVEDVMNCATIACGTTTDVCERLLQVRETTGVSFFVLQAIDLELLDWFARDVIGTLQMVEAARCGFPPQCATVAVNP